MVALQGGACVSVPLDEVAGRTRCVALDHPLLQAARALGIGLGEASSLA
jgi:6-phosphofructokinase 1